ncbi:MAG: hypothetical protein EOO60_05710 [Hymenobacter sp.]|nr:MAG: hypothetical protein EOO60_05710 [Hymenobacter sp.]
MKHHVPDQATVAAVAWSIPLGELRQYVLAVLASNPLFSEAEQLRANHFVHESEDMARLTRWHTNILAEGARREADAARHRGQATLHATLRQLRPFGFRGYRPRKLQPTPTWAPGAPLTNYADHYAGTFDHRVATRFVPEQSLTLTNQLTRSRP